MKKVLITLIITFINLNIILPGFGTELPIPVTDLIKEKFPNSNIRFDGLIELPDGTKYIPVIPISYDYSDNPAEIVVTIPANTDLKSKPDLILFANNLSLLKMIKKSDKVYSLINSPEIPLKVKLGLLPQDLIVPENLVIPPELRVITGDLKIKISDDASKVMVNTQNIKNVGRVSNSTSSIVNSTTKIPAITGLSDLANKTFYATNFHSSLIHIITPQTGRPIKSIMLSSIPSDIAITEDNRYLMATCISSNKVSIIDTTTNNFISEIEVGKHPVSIVMPAGTGKAYIANRLSSNISIIDIKNMTVTNEIPVTGSPTNLTASEDGQSLFYNDAGSGKIYSVRLSYIGSGNNLKINPIINLITQVNNVSKITPFGKYLLISSRSDNTLTIYNLDEEELIKTLEVGKKPVDIQVSKSKNKLYVLSADSHTIHIIDTITLTQTNTISMKVSGFPKSINILDTEDKALITNADSYEIAIIDLDEEKVVSYLPIGTMINSLVVSDLIK